MIFIFDILVNIFLYDREYDYYIIFLFNVARNLTKMFVGTKVNYSLYKI